jgi:hypothetical protein
MENKTGKYFKYAIGEIVLVVVGILIALSINNWNEKEKLIKNEKELIISLKKEITNNILELESSIEKNNLYLETAEKIIHSANLNNELFSAKEINLVFNYTSYHIDSPVLDRIIATNSNLLIENKAQLADFRLLKNRYSGIAKSEYYLDEFWNNKVTDFIISCGLWITDDEIDYQISLKEIEFAGYSKKQFLAILILQKNLHKYWNEAKIGATKKSKEILYNLNE